VLWEAGETVQARGIYDELRRLPDEIVNWERFQDDQDETRDAAEQVKVILTAIRPDASGGPMAKAVVPDDSAWVRSSPSIWKDHLKTNKRLSKFRTDHPDMFRNQGNRRLEIHMGKWAVYWTTRANAGFEALDGDLQSVADDPNVQDEALAGAIQRTAEIRAEKKSGKQ